MKLTAKTRRSEAGAGAAERSADAAKRPAAPVGSQGVRLAALLPPDIPKPPPTDARVRWPAGMEPSRAEAPYESQPTVDKRKDLPDSRAEDDLGRGALGRPALARRAARVALLALVLLLIAAVLRHRGTA